MQSSADMVVSEEAHAGEGSAREDQPLLQSHPVQSLLTEPSVKLRCFVYVLCLIALGFIVALIETEDFSKVHKSQLSVIEMPRNLTNSYRYLKPSLTPNEWICWLIKCLYSFSAIAAIVYLQKRVFVGGTIEKAEMPHPRQDGRLIIVRGALRFIRIPKSLGNYPSSLFVVTFVIFSVMLCLTGVVESVCGGIDALEMPYRELPELFRRILLMIFCVMQSRMFAVHYRHSVQWNLSATWFCGCHLLASNIAFWFFNVGLEVREIGMHRANNSELNRSYCENNHIADFAKMLYPFGIEYYVMSAFLAFSLVINAGRFGTFLGSHISELPSAANQALEINLRSLLREKSEGVTHQKMSEFSIIRKHSASFAMGIGFVLVSLTISVFAAVNSHTDEPNELIAVIFYCLLIFLYSSGLIFTLKLLKFLNRAKMTQLSSTHLTDRLLMWLGAAAITVHDSYTFWITWTKINNEDAVLHIAKSCLLGGSCALNIFQSLMQVYALECALLRKFHITSRRQNSKGRALLNVLIMLNASEWIVNTVCFNLFFPEEQIGNALVLSFVTIPLQVFFRFHSAACMHEFKRHCQPTLLSHPAASRETPRQADIELTFPAMASLMESISANYQGNHSE